MNIKIIIAALVLAGIFGYIWKSNNADKERLAQAESNRVLSIQKAQANEDLKRDQQEQKIRIDGEITSLQSKYAMDYSEAKKIIESEKLTSDDKSFYADISKKWVNALNLASSTPRIALAQPVKDLQTIQSELMKKQTKSYCETKMKDELTSSYKYAIEGFLGFMRQNDFASEGFAKLSEKSQSNANILIDYC